MNLVRRPGPWVFLILWASYGYFWQSRDWNTASRLMLAYAAVDRGTVSIDGLERQTGDRARFGGHYYSDKLPGYPLLAAAPYALVKATLRLRPHPLNGPALAFWPADYWVTLLTSGLLTALTGAALTVLAGDLGCGPRRSALVGLVYGLATPAYAYATLAYGHQASAFALLASFGLIWRRDSRRPGLRAGLAGFLAAYASVIELQVGPVSAVLGLYLVARVVSTGRSPALIGDFAVGALVPTLLLLLYNQLAFGSPWDMGYFHHAEKQFAAVHSVKNPLGLVRPDATRVAALLWGRHRGLLFYAPVVALVPLGLASLAARKVWGLAAVSAAAMAAVFLVNLSYPEWTGGWSTGPRLLVPLLPFAMLPVAAWVGGGGSWRAVVALALGVAGAVVIFLFVSAGARAPQDLADPLLDYVGPVWTGRLIPPWSNGEPFARNPASVFGGAALRRLPAWARGLQFAPLVAAQGVAVALMLRSLRPGPVSRRTRSGC